MPATDKPVVLSRGGVRAAALAMTVICAAQFVLQLDFSVVNVALPVIQRELGMAAPQLQWIVATLAAVASSRAVKPHVTRCGAGRSSSRRCHIAHAADDDCVGRYG